MMQDGGVATAMVIIKDLKRGNIMPIVNDLNNILKTNLVLSKVLLIFIINPFS